MFVGKSKVSPGLMFAAWLIIFSVNACGAPRQGIAAETPVIYVPPVLPGPVTQTDGTLKVAPKLGDEYLPNPGIGWQSGSETAGALEMPESVVYANRREIAWTFLNPADGVYDWSALDAQLQAAMADGKQFSFRVYTMVGESFDGHMIPGWVLEKGAALLTSGEPDYSNCVYQEQWGKFVNELVRRYDGNPDIAFIDISGYGNFNEWSWQDIQTEWDVAWEAGYLSGSAGSDLFETLDGQARRRLADMFIGGAFNEHQCRLVDGEISVVDYSYPGFQKSQLVMPYAGIVQASQYVFSRRTDVGFRYDCLGRDGAALWEKIGPVIDKVWPTAPVIFEFCRPEQFDASDAGLFLQSGHASIVHDNTWRFGSDPLKDMLMKVGYRYFLKVATLHVQGRSIALQMDWQNVGYAPNYPRMGQDFELYFYLVSDEGVIVHEELVPADISQWFPADAPTDSDRLHPVSHVVQLPFTLADGRYYAAVSIVNLRTGTPINLAFGGRDPAGWHFLAPLEIK
jgi:uncharacterized protein DUF4832